MADKKTFAESVNDAARVLSRGADGLGRAGESLRQGGDGVMRAGFSSMKLGCGVLVLAGFAFVLFLLLV